MMLSLFGRSQHPQQLMPLTLTLLQPMPLLRIQQQQQTAQQQQQQ
jgi:hypothetical protein